MWLVENEYRHLYTIRIAQAKWCSERKNGENLVLSTHETYSSMYVFHSLGDLLLSLLLLLLLFVHSGKEKCPMTEYTHTNKQVRCLHLAIHDTVLVSHEYSRESIHQVYKRRVLFLLSFPLPFSYERPCACVYVSVGWFLLSLAWGALGSYIDVRVYILISFSFASDVTDCNSLQPESSVCCAPTWSTVIFSIRLAIEWNGCVR